MIENIHQLGQGTATSLNQIRATFVIFLPRQESIQSMSLPHFVCERSLLIDTSFPFFLLLFIYFILFYFILFYFILFYLGLHPRHMEVPWAKGQTGATAADPCDLQPQQHWI